MTQVLTPSGEGAQTHTRLTHSLKVAQVARGLAEYKLSELDSRKVVYELGGLDADVVEAAALAHDLGHPPFGHIGEVVLDRYGRDELHLTDGFEGNAQSFRIATRLEPRSMHDNGVDGTAATAAAVLKYAWPRPADTRTNGPVKLPKFGFYDGDRAAFENARGWLPDNYPADAQTLEAALMDLADDITYALHDLEDFRTAGLISVGDVESELRTWRLVNADKVLRGQDANDDGTRFGVLRRRLELDSRYTPANFVRAVEEASQHMALLRDAAYRDWRISNETSRRFVSNMITSFSEGIVLNSKPNRENPPADFSTEHWHLVQILKSVTRDRVIGRPDVAAVQRGQQRMLQELLQRIAEWVADPSDSLRVPDELSWLSAHYERRGQLDYVASLTDAQAIQLHAALSGGGDQTVLLGLAL